MIDSAPGTFYHERIECPGEVSMLKIFLVEDEFVVREGIKKNIDWGAHGYQFCGEASDGELAFPMIQKEKPNILITDIRMPFMDGLALSRLVREQLPDTRIIILSGFEEFEYANQQRSPAQRSRQSSREDPTGKQGKRSTREIQS